MSLGSRVLHLFVIISYFIGATIVSARFLQSPCPEVFTYHLDPQTRNYIGRIKVYDIKPGEVAKLSVDLSIGMQLPPVSVRFFRNLHYTKYVSIIPETSWIHCAGQIAPSNHRGHHQRSAGAVPCKLSVAKPAANGAVNSPKWWDHLPRLPSSGTSADRHQSGAHFVHTAALAKAVTEG